MSNDIFTNNGSNDIIRYCPGCGSPLQKDVQFCSICGLKLGPMSQTNAYNVLQDQQNINYQVENQAQSTPSVRYASFGDRFVAFLIDGMLINGIVSLIFLSISFGFNWSFWGSSPIQLLINFLYFYFMEKNSGQTLGKRIMKIKTVDETTFGEITPHQALIHIVGKVFFVGLDVIIGLIMHDSQKNQGKNNTEQIRFTQKYAKTVVIKL